MTQKHTPSHKQERERILSTGIVLIHTTPQIFVIKHSIGVKISENGLISGIIGTSRGLGSHGDKDIKKSVISAPYVWTYEIDPSLECIIIATEGLWQVLQYDVVVDIVSQVTKS